MSMLLDHDATAARVVWPISRSSSTVQARPWTPWTEQRVGWG